jgi:hypothetical protein
MPFIEEKFDQHKVDSLKRYLQREAEKNRTRDYEIVVDGFRVVSRTENLDEFEDYEQEIKPGTRNVTIVIYDGLNTPRNTKYSFLLQQEQTAGKGLNGTEDLGSIIKEKLDARDREHETSQLREKLAETQQQLTEAEEYGDLLEQKIKDLEAGEYKKMVGFGDVAGLLLNGWLKQNPQLIAKIPGGATLAGLLDMPGSTPTPASEETTATFEKKNTPAGANEQKWMLYRNQLEGGFKEEQLDTVFSIVGKLSQEPQHISTVAQLLNLKNE